MIHRIQWLSGTEVLDEVFAIRIEVFCDEQGYSLELELDDKDRQSWHLLLWDDEMAIATGRIYWNGDCTIIFGRIAVRKAWRGKGIGVQMMDAMIEKARALGAKCIQLDAQCRAILFYEKLGFSVCGEEHMDGHVPHKMMQKIL